MARGSICGASPRAVCAFQARAYELHAVTLESHRHSSRAAIYFEDVRILSQNTRDAIKRRSFDGAYFIWGEDDYQKDDAIRQLIEAALDPGARDFNLDTRRSAEVDAETLGVLLSTPPMMAERRIIVFRDVATLGKDARKVLDEYLKRPRLICAHYYWSCRIASRYYAPGLEHVLQFDPLSGDRIPRWIAHRVTSELGLTITEPAIELLQAAVGKRSPSTRW